MRCPLHLHVAAAERENVAFAARENQAHSHIHIHIHKHESCGCGGDDDDDDDDDDDGVADVTDVVTMIRSHCLCSYLKLFMPTAKSMHMLAAFKFYKFIHQAVQVSAKAHASSALVAAPALPPSLGVGVACWLCRSATVLAGPAGLAVA